jgi:hypothetical protein
MPVVRGLDPPWLVALSPCPPDIPCSMPRSVGGIRSWSLTSQISTGVFQPNIETQRNTANLDVWKNIPLRPSVYAVQRWRTTPNRSTVRPLRGPYIGQSETMMDIMGKWALHRGHVGGIYSRSMAPICANSGVAEGD